MNYRLSISGYAALDLLDAMVWYGEQQEGLSNDFEMVIIEALNKNCCKSNRVLG
ncbi:MAG: hypothetical protein LH473_10650 [Chitinophagales bacterium]|nr:hypothetical protein [Chitinophagales bacterium]